MDGALEIETVQHIYVDSGHEDTTLDEPIYTILHIEILVTGPNLSQLRKIKTKGQPLYDMSHNIGVLP